METSTKLPRTGLVILCRVSRRCIPFSYILEGYVPSRHCETSTTSFKILYRLRRRCLPPSYTPKSCIPLRYCKNSTVSFEMLHRLSRRCLPLSHYSRRLYTIEILCQLNSELRNLVLAIEALSSAFSYFRSLIDSVPLRYCDNLTTTFEILCPLSRRYLPLLCIWEG